MVCFGRPYHFRFFKGCLSKTLLGPFLNTLTHIMLKIVLHSPRKSLEGREIGFISHCKVERTQNLVIKANVNSKVKLSNMSLIQRPN